MSTPKNHDALQYLREDTRRLLVTAVIVLGLMAALVFVEHRYHLLQRFIVLPEAAQPLTPIFEPAAEVELVPTE